MIVPCSLGAVPLGIKSLQLLLQEVLQLSRYISKTASDIHMLFQRFNATALLRELNCWGLTCKQGYFKITAEMVRGNRDAIFLLLGKICVNGAVAVVDIGTEVKGTEMFTPAGHFFTATMIFCSIYHSM
ncbi:hypothetical protein FOXG_17116 [Fusarium oxysporum f. sp. lycopersici 4287]|uniref:Uncharacterized protein n=2 Tax=Fusarium oxysporum TaxID=5507 RepID=A0A0J9WBQ2_FUSO4|nr:hypothetical protein FOXG_17116 [Fusarium oxysporum f. sp. lycopersici 4287]KNB19960.1 hypothetical protein FOXG_17116 [Fusarium oxysporum f. sp. lycopersici 4287]